MSENVIFGLTLAATLGSAAMFGLFFIFSVCIMTALGRLPPPQGIAAMKLINLGRLPPPQGIAAMKLINLVIVNPLFLLAFLGTPVLCLILGVEALLRLDDADAPYLLAGALSFVIGTFLVTAVFNIPRNNTLDAVDAESAAGASYWQGYLETWTAWNHLRTLTSMAATALFAIALSV
jgi:uncharacterized membrane protein